MTSEVTSFVVAHATKSAREFQGHNEMHLHGKYLAASATLPTGTIVVRLAQPLGRLAAYLLEPESDDGLVDWNFFDASLTVGEPAPVRKIMGNVKMSTRVLEKF